MASILPPRGGKPSRAVAAMWLRNRWVPAIAAMVGFLAEEAATRLGPPHVL